MEKSPNKSSKISGYYKLSPEERFITKIGISRKVVIFFDDLRALISDSNTALHLIQEEYTAIEIHMFCQYLNKIFLARCQSEKYVSNPSVNYLLLQQYIRQPQPRNAI